MVFHCPVFFLLLMTPLFFTFSIPFIILLFSLPFFLHLFLFVYVFCCVFQTLTRVYSFSFYLPTIYFFWYCFLWYTLFVKLLTLLSSFPISRHKEKSFEREEKKIVPAQNFHCRNFTLGILYNLLTLITNLNLTAH